MIFMLFIIIILGFCGYNLQEKYHFFGDGVTHVTIADVDSFSTASRKTSTKMPEFKQKSLLSDIPSSKYYNSATGKEGKIAVWDSWPVQNPDGTVANFHGYRIVIGLTSKDHRNDGDAHMGMYVQKISDDSNDLSTWQYIGNVFNYYGEGAPNGKPDKYLQQIKGEWSGSTVMMDSKSNTLRVFYANAMTKGQALTTAQITLDPKKSGDWNSGLTINHSKTKDHKTVFVGDGYYYQTVSQNAGHADKMSDELAMRDPHFVADGDKYYLVFEGNTGSKYHIQGKANFMNYSNYGNWSTYKYMQKKLLDNKDTNLYGVSYYANSAIGKIELNSDFSLKKVLKPMVVANLVNDELERVNLFQFRGKWYLFTTSWGAKFASTTESLSKNAYMLGYVSDNGINGSYKKLNGNGLVLNTNLPKSGMTYAYLVIPNKNQKNNKLVVTSFEDSHTFAPSFLLEVNGHKTKVINNKVLDQGALVDNGHYYKAKPESSNK
ncbi:glycoside hydrolase family 68 protein [Fructobacillus durionis]|nr:glycoside hydrolase family 68 protein [Fructobacillus durionis]